MKPFKHPLAAALLLLSTSCASEAFSQSVPPETCIMAFHQSKIDSVKQSLISQGFSLLKEASLTMESSYEMPVVMHLAEGNNYRFVFIGDPASGLYAVSLSDWKENQLFHTKHESTAAEGNIIDYSFSAECSEYHVFKPLQVSVTQKRLCGYVLMFRKI